MNISKTAVYTTVSKKVLDLYNEIMDGAGEEPYVVSEGYIGDCYEGLLRDEAVDGKVVVDFGSLLCEMEYNLLDKQGDIVRYEVECGDMTSQKAAGIMRRNRNLIRKFKKSFDGNVDEWFLATI